MPSTASDRNSVFEARQENLAVIFQEALTIIMRLREGRAEYAQAGTNKYFDAAAFREMVIEILRQADRTARTQQYSAESVRLAMFAVVAFIDESVLKLGGDVFADWVRKPLQEAMFGVALAGNIFFDHVDRLIQQPDSAELADVLEVHQLCLMLGFRGRYSAGMQSDLRAVISTLKDRIDNIRRSTGDLSPHWQLPADQFAGKADPWFGRLAGALAVCAVLAIVLFVLYSFSLGSGVSAVQALPAELQR